MRRKITYGLFSALLGVSLLFNSPIVNAEENIDDKSKNIEVQYYEMDLKAEIEKAKRDAEFYKNKLADIEGQLNKLKLDKDYLEEEIVRIEKVANLTYDKIKTTTDEISEIKKSLDDLYIEIQELEAELEKREDAFRKRIQSSSKLNFFSYFDVIFTSDTFSEMVNKLNHISKIVEKDNQIIEEYLEISEKLEKKKKEHENLLKSLENKVKELENIRKELLAENEKNKEEVKGVSSGYESLLIDYKNIKIKYQEVNQLYVKLEEQKKLIDEFSKYIKEQAGDYGLNPLLEFKRKELIKLASDKGIKLITTAGLRTFEEQDRLYAKGRDGNGGSIVTNARGGQSWHNYGFAFDVAFDNGQGVPTWEQYDMNNNGKDDWNEIGEIGQSIGLEWGGVWTTLVDRPHFQYTFGKTLSEMQKLYRR